MKKIFLKFLKIILSLIIIISVPFIYPLVSRFFIHINLFTSVEELKNYFSIFWNWFFIILVIIAVIIAYVLIYNKDKLIRWLENRDFIFNVKGAGIESKLRGYEMVSESAKKKNILNELNDETNGDKITLQDVKNELKNKSSKKVDEIVSLKKENDNLRFYSAYNIINKKAKELLHTIYCEKSIDLSTFKNGLIYSFKNRNKRNKNLTKSQINEYANNKYETIKEGLQYLNIIEISDDDKITLTKYGKEFVEKYIENEVGEDED